MKKGFTLMEILIYIAILAVIISAVAAFLSWAIQSSNKSKAMREVLDNARTAMEIMTYEIKEAKGIYTPTSTSTQLSLETTHYLPSGESSSYLDFYLCGNNSATLCLKKESQLAIALTSETVEINNLQFILISPTTTPSIQINLGINFKNPKSRPEYQASINLRSSASLRTF